MAISTLEFSIFLLVVMAIQNINSTKDVRQTSSTVQEPNPLANVILNQSEIGDASRSGEHTNALSRVKRQFYYNPDYRYRRPYYYPLPIFIGGGGFVGGGGFGGRGFGGHGFGGRGIGGRGGGGFGGGHGGRG